MTSFALLSRRCDRAPFAWAATALVAACASENSTTASFVPLDPVAETTAPQSGNIRIALTTEEVACVIDSYEIRIHCTDRDDTRVGYFGREGDGPGEFEDPRWIVRAPDGGIAVVDWGRARRLVFRPTGELLSETKVPPAFIPSPPVAASLFGVALVSGEYLTVEVDPVSGEVEWSRQYPPPEELAGADCGEEQSGPRGFAIGSPTPRGGMLFRACRGRFLAWLADRDDDEPAQVAAVPTYRRTLPTEAEVDGYVWGLTRLAGGAAPPASDVEDFRSRPRNWHKSHTGFDGRGRAWMATRRNGDDFSYIDVHDGTAYLGTVRIRHSLLELDIVGSVMVVLVDRPLRPDDPAGIPRRGIDWYDIGGVDFSKGGWREG